MADVILFFSSNADTMIATKALKDAGVTAKMIPKPAAVNSASNLCLSIDGGVEVTAVSALRTANIALGGVVK
ncbi:MAG TPA: putative Se/S carrier-like protein [Candidatus Baltobacteraceae bacterium]|nr:putative Se/S carrier-like protein [Candidatus Baltobacteraceae bacterium]